MTQPDETPTATDAVDTTTLKAAAPTDAAATDATERPHGSMYMYPRRSSALMWFEYIVGAALVIGGLYVAVRQFMDAANGGGVWDVVAGVIGLVLVGMGALLIREGYQDRPVDL